MSQSTIVVQYNDWNVDAVKYMAPKVNKQQGKSISILNSTANRSLYVTTPLLHTWGCSDFMNEDGTNDGKFSVQLNLPNKDYETKNTKIFLEKMKAFEEKIIDDAVKNSEEWWGEEMDRGILKHTFFPFVKYQKDKTTKKIDTSKPPSIKAKVPVYDDVWNVEIYDTKQTRLFPDENSMFTPIDLIPKQSRIACVLQCGGIWIGGKGWGLTWKMSQCIVKPRDNVTISGSCHIQLSDEDSEAIDNQELPDDSPAEEPQTNNDVEVEDSDNEAEPEPEPEPVEEPEPEPVVEPIKKKVVKKVVKKTKP
jgi:hypothetical protein